MAVIRRICLSLSIKRRSIKEEGSAGGLGEWSTGVLGGWSSGVVGRWIGVLECWGCWVMGRPGAGEKRASISSGVHHDLFPRFSHTKRCSL